MLLYLKLSFGKAMILSALFESLLLVMDYFASVSYTHLSELDENLDTYNMSAYLIAQLAKNYTLRNRRNNRCIRLAEGAHHLRAGQQLSGSDDCPG